MSGYYRSPLPVMSTDLLLKPLRVALLLSPALVAVLLLLPQLAYPFFS